VDLTKYSLYGGNFTAVQTIDNTADVVAVVPDRGRVYSFIINVHTVIATAGGVDQTFDILLNGTDTGVNVGFVDGLVDETGVEMIVLNQPTDEIHVEIGDALSIRSNGEQAGATTADGMWVIERE